MLSEHQTLIIASHNQGKIDEFKSIFAPFHIEVRSLQDYTGSGLPMIIEDGETFADNAFIKAKLIAEHLQLPVLADDSGLCVNALEGEPGVFSARYAGEHATDQQNNDKLLSILQKMGASVESEGLQDECLSEAQFVCVLVLYDPLTEKKLQAEGVCEGYITAEPRGEHGFGYDPLFFVPQYNKTMAELLPEQKNDISHRGAAIRTLLQELGLKASD